MTLRSSLIALAMLSLAGCPGTSSVDAGGGNDVGRDAEMHDTPSFDAFASPLDAVVSDDVYSPPLTDVTVRDTGVDTGTSAPDTGTRDAGPAAPGMCDTTMCTPTCIRAVTCVTVCGGPVTMCGCCACAPGSVDTVTCASSM